MGEGILAASVWQQQIKSENSSQARFLRWYHEDKYSKLAKPCTWDANETTSEALHGYHRAHEKPVVEGGFGGSISGTMEARQRRERRTGLLGPGAGNFDTAPSTLYRPRDHGGIIMTLGDHTMAQTMRMRPTATGAMPSKIPGRPISAGSTVVSIRPATGPAQHSTMSTASALSGVLRAARLSSAPALSEVGSAAGSRVVRGSRLSRASTSLTNLSRSQILEKAQSVRS